MEEIWKSVKEFDGLYEVSNLGRVARSLWNGRRLLKFNDKKGYKKVILSDIYGKGKVFSRAVHRLVAIAFIPNPENKREVNHKNGIKHDNRVENLEWVTQEENRWHSVHVLGNTWCAKKPTKYFKERRLKPVDRFTLFGEYIDSFESLREASRESGATPYSISQCCKGNYKRAGRFIWRYRQSNDISLAILSLLL